MALSAVAAESTPDKGFHLEPGHEEEHHDDVFKKKAAPASVSAVRDKAQSFRSIPPLCHQEVSRTSTLRTKL